MSVNHKELKKSGFIRQRQQNYFSVRLNSIGGHFTVEQLDTIQKVAATFGKGYIHLTSRQGIEIPFIHLNNVDEVKTLLVAGGVKIGGFDSLQLITACKGNAVCPSGRIDTIHLAEEFYNRYCGRELPHKFKFGFTGCRNNCLKAEENDIGIQGCVKPIWQSANCNFCGVCQTACPQKIIAVDKTARSVVLDESNCLYCGKCIKSCPHDAWLGENGFIVFFAGENFLPIIFDEATLYKIVDAALKFSKNNAKIGERFKDILARVGLEKFTSELRTIKKPLENI